MRLIDADELEEMFLRNAQIIDEYEQEDEFAARGMNCYGFKKLLDEQPTAYNVDKVVEQMESCPYTQDWIEIVRNGGVNEND